MRCNAVCASQIHELESVADFPSEMDKFREVLMKVMAVKQGHDVAWGTVLLRGGNGVSSSSPHSPPWHCAPL